MEKVETNVLDSMYHRIQNCSLPCKAKPSFESSSCKQLLACDIKEHTDDVNDEFSITLKRLKIEQAKQNESMEISNDCFAPFSINELINKLSTHLTNDNQQEQEISGWSSCPSIHIHLNQVERNSQDIHCKSAHHLLSYSSNNDNAKNTSMTRSQSAGSPKKTRVNGSPISNSCRASDECLWTEPPPPMPIPYLFKHYKYPRQYVIQYREKYTYKKLKERLSLIKHFVSSGGSIPKAHLVCIDSRQGVRGVTLGNKTECDRIVESFEQVIQDKKRGKDHQNQKWNLFGHLNDRCDPTLSVNNPSPTEIATFAKMPTVRRSSPSIPSNSNGRFGFRGTRDSHYPFQLNISVGSCTISTPNRKSTRGLITH